MKKPVIICIETALDVCSVAVAEGEEVILLREEKGSNIHSARLTVFMEELLLEMKNRSLSPDAVCVSKGPGSYTGLRIGVSAAKGIAYALDLPLLSVNTLEALAIAAMRKGNIAENNALLCPMIDARRMEVYCAVYDKELNEKLAVQAAIVDENSFSELLKNEQVCFFGNGMPKCRPLLEVSPNAFFIEDIEPGAAYLAPLALKKYERQAFENVFTFEPFYLKDFITTSKAHKVNDVLKSGNQANSFEKKS